MLPKAIQAQIEAADALVEQMNGPAPTEVAETAPEVNHEPAPQAPEPVAEVQIPQAQPAPQPQEDVDWKARFHTLKGKYDAEVPRLNQQVRELQGSVQTLLEEVERTKNAPRTQEPASLVTDADREAFGADLIDVVERATKSHLTPLQQEVERLRQERAEMEARFGKVNEEVQMSAQDRFYNNLAKEVPNWQAVNQDQAFLVWLGETDPVFGVARQAALDNAAGKMDPMAAAAVFNAFLNSRAPAKPDPRQELNSQVAPSRSRVAPVPTADDGANKIWSDGEIQRFYADVRRGVYTTAEADRLEDQIHRAVAEGRVR